VTDWGAEVDWTRRGDPAEFSDWRKLLKTLDHLEDRGVTVSLYDGQGAMIADWTCWGDSVREDGPDSAVWSLRLTADDRVSTTISLPAPQFERASRSADDDGLYFRVNAQFETFRLEVREAEIGLLDGEAPH